MLDRDADEVSTLSPAKFPLAAGPTGVLSKDKRWWTEFEVSCAQQLRITSRVSKIFPGELFSIFFGNLASILGKRARPGGHCVFAQTTFRGDPIAHFGPRGSELQMSRPPSHAPVQLAMRHLFEMPLRR
jgi:hypothetical protein